MRGFVVGGWLPAYLPVASLCVILGAEKTVLAETVDTGERRERPRDAVRAANTTLEEHEVPAGVRHPHGPDNTPLVSGVAHDHFEIRAKGVDSPGDRANQPWDDEAARRLASAALLRARRLDSREVEKFSVLRRLSRRPRVINIPLALS